jgi:hypothetical protein
MNRRRCVPARLLVALLGCAGAILIAGCSSSSSSAPSLFPAVLDTPPPREDTPLSPEQVKQAMDNLTADRNRLCAEATANGTPNATAANCGNANAAATGSTPAAGGTAKP